MWFVLLVVIITGVLVGRCNSEIRKQKKLHDDNIRKKVWYYYG